MENKETVVLAYSGGLDTSYCVKYLSEELGLTVHTVLVDTGGFHENELQEVERRANELGSARHTNINKLEEFYQKAIKFMVYGNILKNGTYPLSVSSERVVQAMAIAEYAQEIGAKYIAHGSTGAGNDQVRFDLIFNIMAPEVEILTPIRDQSLSRQEEIEFLKKHGVDMQWDKAKYSVNQGIWGTSIGGSETLTSHSPLPEEAYPHPLQAREAQACELEFEKGEIVGVNKTRFEPVQAIQYLNDLAHQFAIGRDIHVGDTIIGIKGRVGFEAPAPLIIIKAHHALEKHNLSKWQLYWKEQLANWYGMLLHEGQYLEPVMRNIETFLEDSQKFVTGMVKVKLFPYRFEVQGVISDYDLMDTKQGAYGEMNKGWTGEDVRGFTKILANHHKISYQKQKAND